MPKNQLDRTIDNPYSRRTGGGAGVVVSGSTGGSSGVTDHGLLTGLADDDHTQYFNTARGDARYLQTSRTLTAGAGLTGGGDLSADRTFTVGAGLGITVNADDVALAATVAGDGLTYSSGVLAVGVSGLGLSVAADAVTLTSSSNPGAAAAILASTAGGGLTLVTLTASTSVTTPTVATGSGALALAPASGAVNLPAGGVLGTGSGGYTLAPTTDITLDPAGDDVLIASSARIGTDNYASQLTGWRIDYLGAGDFRYLFADELHAKSFITDLEQALAGGQIIAKSVAMLSRAFTIPAAGAAATLYVRDLPSAENMAVFQSGDIVRLRQFSRAAGSLTIADAWGVVTSYSDLADKEQSWTFTRSAAPNAGTASGTIAADSLALDYGTTGNGFHEVNAIDGLYGLNSPYSQVVTWTTHPATGSAVRVRTGNLRGITGSTEYGLWAGSTTAQNLLITGDKVALRQGTTEYITLAADGTSYFSGVMTIGAAGEIRQGTGTLGSNYTGLRIWRDTNVGRIGGYNSNTLQWYGSTDGRLYGGAGAVYLDSGGLGLTVHPSALTDANAVTWRTSGPTGATAAKIGAYASGGASVLRMQAGSNYLFMSSSGYSDFNQTLYLASGGAHAIVATNLGVGLTPDVDTPAARLHVMGTTPEVRIQSGAAENIYLSFHEATTLRARFTYAGTAGAGGKYFGIVNYGADYVATLSDNVRWLSGSGTEWMRLDSTGLGIGGTPGVSEKLLVSGGSGVVFSTLHSSHPNHGPVFRISSTATNGRVYGLRSSQGNDSILPSGTGAGNFQIIDYSANAVRWQMDANGHIRQAGNLTLGDSSILTLEVNNTADTGGVIVLNSRDTHPAAPGVSTRVNMYMKGSFIVFEYSDTGDGVTRYFYHDMESAAGTWTQNTVGP